MTLRAARVNQRSANSVPLCGAAKNIARLKLVMGLRRKRACNKGSDLKRSRRRFLSICMAG